MPIFCNTPAYSVGLVYECLPEDPEPEYLLTRYDYIIGIHKFNGPVSYPRDEGIFSGVIWDFLLLLSLLFLKSYQISVGLSNYVSTDGNVYETPKFRCDEEFMTSHEKE